MRLKRWSHDVVPFYSIMPILLRLAAIIAQFLQFSCALLCLAQFAQAQTDATLATSSSPAAALKFSVQIDTNKDLRELLEKNLELLRWRDSPQLDADQFLRLYRAAPEQIRKLLASEGYYQPQISSSLQRDSEPWQASFVVQPGVAVRVAQVEIRLQERGAGPEGGGDYPAPHLLSDWNLPAGSVFRHADWEAAKRALVRKLSLVRFPRAQLMESTRAEVDVAQAEVSLVVVVDSGPEVSFGALQVEGLQRYPISVVHNLNTIQAGMPYTEQALLDLQQALQDSNYFANVVVSAEFNEEMDAMNLQAVVPVLVRLKEYKRKKVDAGIGYSTNTGNRLQLVLEDLAWLGMQTRSKLLLETRQQQAALDFILPTSARGYHDSFGAIYERTELEGEETAQFRLAYRRRWGNQQLSRDFGIEYIHQRKTIGGLPQQASSSLPLKYEATWRKLDDFLKPRQGYLLQAQISGAPLPLFGSKAFLRLYARGMHYWPLGQNGQVISRAEFGALASKATEEIPATYLFRAGGDQSVRGFSYQQLGVKLGDAVTGGRYLATASIEYQHWFKPAYGAAVFVDAGNAANQPRQLRPAWGMGIGARWQSPIGPVNLDVAQGRGEPGPRLHFSLGLAF